MSKYTCIRGVRSAEGYQEFYVEADSEEEAIEKFKAGEGEWYADEYSVTGLEDYDFDTVCQTESEL